MSFAGVIVLVARTEDFLLPNVALLLLVRPTESLFDKLRCRFKMASGVVGSKVKLKGVGTGLWNRRAGKRHPGHMMIGSKVLRKSHGMTF